MLPTSLPGGSPGGITSARPTTPRSGQLGQAGHARGLQRCATVELVQRNVGAAVGHEHDVLHAEDLMRNASC